MSINEFKLILLCIGINSTIFIVQYVFLTVVINIINLFSNIKWSSKQKVMFASMIGVVISINIFVEFITDTYFYIGYNLDDAVNMIAQTIIYANIIYGVLELPDILANMKNK